MLTTISILSTVTVAALIVAGFACAVAYTAVQLLRGVDEILATKAIPSWFRKAVS